MILPTNDLEGTFYLMNKIHPLSIDPNVTLSDSFGKQLNLLKYDANPLSEIIEPFDWYMECNWRIFCVGRHMEYCASFISLYRIGKNILVYSKF